MFRVNSYTLTLKFYRCIACGVYNENYNPFTIYFYIFINGKIYAWRELCGNPVLYFLITNLFLLWLKVSTNYLMRIIINTINQYLVNNTYNRLKINELH